MSFDVIVLNPSRLLRSLEELGEDDSTSPLGTVSEIRDRCSTVFPGLEWQSERSGLVEGPGTLAIEFSIPEGDEVESLHLALHFGGDSDAGLAHFDSAMESLLQQWGWQSFAVSDSSAIVGNADA